MTCEIELNRSSFDIRQQALQALPRQVQILLSCWAHGVKDRVRWKMAKGSGPLSHDPAVWQRVLSPVRPSEAPRVACAVR